MYDDSNLSFFDHPRRAYIFLSMIISLLSFHLPFSLFILFYAALFPVILSISQNKIDVTIFFLENFCVPLYIFLPCYRDHHFYSIQVFVIVYFPPLFFFSSSFWSLIASKRYETGKIDLFFILFHNILSCRPTLAQFVFPLFTWRIYHFLSGISCLYSKFVY